ACVADDPNGADLPNALTEFDEVAVARAAVVDAAGNESAVSERAGVSETTAPVVTVTGAVAGGNSFAVVVAEAHPADGARVDVDEITIVPVGETGVDLEAPSAIIYDTSGANPGGGTVCLFGIHPATADLPAGRQACVADDPNGDAAPNVLAELDKIAVVAGAIVDAAGNRSQASAEASVPDETPPAVTIVAVAGESSFTVAVVDAGLAAGSRIEIDAITITRPGEAEPPFPDASIVHDTTGANPGGGTVCLAGQAPGSQASCAPPAGAGGTLAGGDRIVVAG
ncbi:MAG TPA: hypothetical protein DEP69_04885, partial [Acidimicrobiaceae bacterium]|nr:hypothetical protein [Acidimicrobiaceae bacterium]